MYRKCHLGVSMLVFALVGYWLVTTGTPELALLAGTVMVWFTVLPDIGYRLPVIDHRGVTHSLLFAVFIGGLFAGVGLVFDGVVSVSEIDLGVYGFLLGTLTVGAHLIKYILTPAYVPLLWPIS